MSVLVVLGIGVLGGAGAIARFKVDGAVARRMVRPFPFGTLTVNLSGAFVLGVLVGIVMSDTVYDLLGTGFIGAYTTFSTWMLESERLIEEDEPLIAWANIAVSLFAGTLLAWLGQKLGGEL